MMKIDSNKVLFYVSLISQGESGLTYQLTLCPCIFSNWIFWFITNNHGCFIYFFNSTKIFRCPIRERVASRTHLLRILVLFVVVLFFNKFFVTKTYVFSFFLMLQENFSLRFQSLEQQGTLQPFRRGNWI